MKKLTSFFVMPLILFWGVAATAQVTATKSTVFYYTQYPFGLQAFQYYQYNWTVNLGAATPGFNSFQVSFASFANFSTYNGPGAQQNGPPGVLQVIGLGAQAIPGTITFNTQSVYSPTAIEGLQTFTLGNYPAGGPFAPVIGGNAVAAGPATQPANITEDVGSTAVAFAGGTFAPDMDVTLVQDDQVVGYTTSLSDGSANVALTTALNGDPLFIGDGTVGSGYDTILQEVMPVPEPSAYSFAALSGIALLCRFARRKS